MKEKSILKVTYGKSERKTVPLGVNQKRRVGNNQTGHRMLEREREDGCLVFQ